MCEATTLMLIMAGVSAAAGVAQQKQQADYQEAVNEQQYKNTMAARAENINQVGLARQQHAESSAQKINEQNVARREAQAAVVAQGRLSGLSVDALLGDIERKGSSYNTSVHENFERVNMSLNNQLTNVNRGAAGEINSLRSPAKPDYLGAALKIGSAYAGYSSGARTTGGRDPMNSIYYSNRGMGD